MDKIRWRHAYIKRPSDTVIQFYYYLTTYVGISETLKEPSYDISMAAYCKFILLHIKKKPDNLFVPMIKSFQSYVSINPMLKLWQFLSY